MGGVSDQLLILCEATGGATTVASVSEYTRRATYAVLAARQEAVTTRDADRAFQQGHRMAFTRCSR